MCLSMTLLGIQFILKHTQDMVLAANIFLRCSKEIITMLSYVHQLIRYLSCVKFTYSFESQSKRDSEKISRNFFFSVFCILITSSTYVWKTCCRIMIDQENKRIVMKLHGSSQTLIILFFLFRKRNSKSVFEIILIIKSVIRQTTELIVHSSSWLMITRW